MKKIVVLIGLFSFSIAAFAQQDAQVTHNMFNKLSVNPGYAGSGGGICGTLIMRSQWAGFGGGPKTAIVSVDSPVKKLHGGAGLTLVSDALGNEKTVYAKAAYAYRQAIGPGILGAGLDLGYLQKSIVSEWTTPSGGDGTEDSSIPDVGVSDGTFDIGFGAYYQIPGKAYVGLSALHLQASELKATGLTYQMVRNYYIMGGYEYEINDMLTVKPNVLIKTDFASTQFDINGLLYYNNTFWGGLNYRTVDAFSLMLGYQMKIDEKMSGRIGYSYDLTTSKIRTKSSGSHEIMLGLCYVPQSKFKVTKYKNVRFL